MSQQPFKKFINPKNNAAIKEKHKQEKKIAKKQRASAIEKHFDEKRAARFKGFENKSEPEKKINKKQKYPQRKEVIIPGKISSDSPISSSPDKKKTKHTC